MPGCDITNGRIEQCKDSVSGLKAIYFINYDELNPDDVTYVSGTDEIDDWSPIGTGALPMYKYELKGANSFETTINSSRDNGTTFFQQTLTIQLKRQDPTTHKNVKLLAYGRPRIVVRTMTDQFFLMGLTQGADVTSGTVSSGSALGDFNGYNLTFEAMEVSPANFLNVTDEAGLKTLFEDGAGLDANIITS
jgi:hypothetical protein